jgi:glucose 1-dehydrogenase
MKLNGKVALVTGSSGGIGQSIAIRLAQDGAKVVVNYRSNPEGAEQTLDAINQIGGECLMVDGFCVGVGDSLPLGTASQYENRDRGYAVGADLGMVDDVRRLIAESIEYFGTIDILVNNAGIEKRADFWDVTEQDFDAVMNINFKGVFFATQFFVKHQIDRDKQNGRIINISSVHEDLPFPYFASYCASKGALKMMMRNLSVELGGLGITINNVAPGAIETPINKQLINNPAQLQPLLKNISLGRLGQPDDIAAVVAFLASDDARYITGSTVVVDGGLLWNYQEQ